MGEKRAARKQGSGWLVAVPRSVRDRLKLTEPGPVWWHLGRRGEAVLTRKAIRTAGGPDSTSILNELTEARKLIDYLRHREESRDRAMYAEGYALGRQDQAEVLVNPTGKRANELLRRRNRHHAWGGRVPPGYVAVEKERRPRRARRVETVDAPVLATGEAREQIDAAAARLGAGIGFALAPGVVAVTVPDPD